MNTRSTDAARSFIITCTISYILSKINFNLNANCNTSSNINGISSQIECHCRIGKTLPQCMQNAKGFGKY